jgi:hypothetical protein
MCFCEALKTAEFSKPDRITEENVPVGGWGAGAEAHIRSLSYNDKGYKLLICDF